jgi:hypothetical protein
MSSLVIYEYAIVRVVPRVDRGEFVNAGVIISCKAQNFLGAQVELNEKKILGLDLEADIALMKATLETIPAICAGSSEAGAVGKLSARERFDWLVAPRSTSIQTSPVHTGRCASPQQALEDLMKKMVRG